MPSMADTLARSRGLGPGFDFLRIALAASIVVSHSFMLTGNPWFRVRPTWFAEYALVPMFFALSGFLIAGSAMRLSLKNFLINRALRIFPALAVDVVICALIIGPLVTTVSLKTYFTDSTFYIYFLNMLGWVHYSLPGVFEDHVLPVVNGSLWTVPYEIFCYGIMSGLIVTRCIKNPPLTGALVAAMLVVGIGVERLGTWLPARPGWLLGAIFVHRGAQIVLAFLMGIVAYQIKHLIPYSRKLAGLCALVCVAAVFLLEDSAIYRVENRLIVLPALVYVTIFLGLTPIPLPKILRTGDYSYGVYLYHGPLLQVIIGLIPAVVLIQGWGALALAAFGLPAVGLLAAFSWHVIEKPVLGLRKRFSFVARVRGVAKGTDLSVAPVLPGTSVPMREPSLTPEGAT